MNMNLPKKKGWNEYWIAWKWKINGNERIQMFNCCRVKFSKQKGWADGICLLKMLALVIVYVVCEKWMAVKCRTNNFERAHLKVRH